MKKIGNIRRIMGLFCISLAVGYILIFCLPRWALIALILLALIAAGIYLLKC